MIRIIIFFLFVSFSFTQANLLLAEDNSVFDDMELKGIDGADTTDDASLDQQFKSIDEDENPDNFDPSNFEIDEQDEGRQEDSGKDSESNSFPDADLNANDREYIGGDPDYEIVDDDSLTKEFEGDKKEENKGFESDIDTSDFDNETSSPEDGFVDDATSVPMGDDGSADDATSVPMGDDGSADDAASVPMGDDVVSEQGDMLSSTVSDSEAFNLVTNIRYLSEKNQIVIDCSETISYKVRKNEETNQFIIEVFQAKLGENLDWPYSLRDFKTDFGFIKADQKDSNTVRIVIQLKEGSEFPNSVLTEEGNQIVVAYRDIFGNAELSQAEKFDSLSSGGSSILSAKTFEDNYLSPIQFSGYPISVHVIKAPVTQVLRFISEESGLNMVIGEKVSGEVTLKLEDVPWDQVLHTILRVKSLGYTREGNVITILPLTEIKSRTEKIREISENKNNLVPYETKVIPISYGKMTEIHSKLKDFLTQTANKKGKIILHEESNTFVVIDTPQAIQKIESLVKYLDKAPKQVMVEAKIVEVSETFVRNFGLNWGVSGNLPVTISASGLADLLGSFHASYSTSIRAGSNSSSLSVGGLPVIGDINASLSLAESEGHAQVISTPKVVVISGKQASINRNSPIQIPTSTTTTTSVSGDTSTQEAFEQADVSITLSVTPTVTSRGSIFLQVNVNRSDPGGRGGALKTDRSATTEVLAKNGQTIVIGGIYEQDEVRTNDGLPFLRHIPFLNMLFSTAGKNSSKAELLVFITPKILDAYE